MNGNREDVGRSAQVVRKHGASAWQLAVVASGSITAATDTAARGLSMAASAGGAEDVDRPLVLASVRRCALEARVGDTDDLNGVLAHRPGGDREPVVRVFAELSEPWRSALWMATIERLSPHELTAALNLDAHDTHLVLTRVVEAVDRRAATWRPTGDGTVETGGRVPLSPAAIGTALATLDLDPPADLETAIHAIWATHRRHGARTVATSDGPPEAVPVPVDDLEPSRRRRLLAMATRSRPQVPAGAAVMVLALGALAVVGAGHATGSAPVPEPTGRGPGASAEGGSEGGTVAGAPGDGRSPSTAASGREGASGTVMVADDRSGETNGSPADGTAGGGEPGPGAGSAATSPPAPVAPAAPGSDAGPRATGSAGPGSSEQAGAGPSSGPRSPSQPPGPVPVTGPSLHTTVPAPPPAPPAPATRPPTTRSSSSPPTTRTPTTPTPTTAAPASQPAIPLPTIDTGALPVEDPLCGRLPCP